MLRNSAISEFFVLISMRVPPLKSIPKFNPLKINRTTEIIINTKESALKNLKNHHQKQIMISNIKCHYC